MAQKITKRLVDSLEAVGTTASGNPKRCVVFDTELRGFGVRVTPAGAKTYFCDYRVGKGRRAPKRRYVIGQHGAPWTVENARSEAKKVLLEAAGGRDPVGTRRLHRQGQSAATVAEMCELWLRHDQHSNRTHKMVKRTMERDVLPFIGQLPPESLKKRDLVAVVDRVSKRSPVFANRVLAFIKRMCRWSANKDLIEADPAASLLRPARENKRDRILNYDEIRLIWSLLDTTNRVFADGVRVLMLTGARREEVFTARWNDYSNAEKTLVICSSRSKSKEARRIPLSNTALNIIESRPRINSFIFTSGRKRRKSTKENEVGTHWSMSGNCKKELDEQIARFRRHQMTGVEVTEPISDEEICAWSIPHWRIHDFRRTIATACQGMGVPVEVTEDLLGHKSGTRSGIVGVYQQYRYEAEKRQAVELWERRLQYILDEKIENLSFAQERELRFHQI